MRRLWSVTRRFGLDVLVVLAAIEGALEVVLRRDTPRAPDTALWFAVPATAVILLPLLARRRFPLAAPATVWLLAALVSFVDGELIGFTRALYAGGMLAAYLLGRLDAALHARLGLGIVLVCAATIQYNSPEHGAAELVFVPLLFALGWFAGFALRERAQQAEAAEVRAAAAERERDAATRVAVAEERARIARELHDVVAHSVSVMVLQVGAIRHNLPEALAEDRAALSSVEQAGRTALAEMRRLLAAMRREGDEVELTPQPGLDGIDLLVEQIGRAGLPVRLRVVGEPVPVPPGVDLSAYRIVQEGLTNALRHARASKAEVTIRHQPDELRIEIRDDGEAAPPGDGGPTRQGVGYGLIGVRERVKIFGGEMSAGRVDGGGFVLDARLPLRGDRP